MGYFLQHLYFAQLFHFLDDSPISTHKTNWFLRDLNLSIGLYFK
jgi:hypothetical protein